MNGLVWSLLLLLLLTGCLDFTALKFACYDAGSCKRDTSNGPKVVTQTPLNNAMNVKAVDSIVLTFSRAMDPVSLSVDLTPPPNPLGPPDFDTDNVTAVFSPVGALSYSTKYTATVHGSAADDGAPLQSTVFTFTTEGPPDMVAPALSQSVPMNGAMNVAVGSSLTLTFSEAMKQQSITVISTPDFDWGTATWMANGATVRFLAPPAPLEGNTDYTLGIDGLDLAGNPLTGAGTVVFTTGAPPDATPPTVISTSPPAGATMISPSANVSFSVQFSEAMKPTTTQAFSVRPAVSNLACVFDVAGVLMTCSHPATPLDGGTMYTMTLRSGADGGAKTEDLAGNLLQQDFSSTFTTGAVQDVTPPTVVSVFPDAGALGQPYAPFMRVTFSEPMDPALTQAAIVVSSPNGITIGSSSWDPTGRTVTVTPTPPQGGFVHGTQVNWQIGTGAKDLSGISLAMTQQYTFKVRRQLTTTLYSIAADGYMRKGAAYTPYATTNSAFVGDDSANNAFKAYLFFDFNALNGIPANALGIVTATLRVHIYSRIGDPPGSLSGGPIAYSIPYVAAFTSTQWANTQYNLPGCFFCGLFTSDAIGYPTTNVKPHLQHALTARKVLMRIEYVDEEDFDSDNDWIGMHTSETTGSDRPQITVTYEVP